METSASEVLQLFESSAQARAAFREWRANPRREGVPAVALVHVSKYVYDGTGAQLAKLRKSILDDSNCRYPPGGPSRHPRDPEALHPLGNIRWANAVDERAEDWSAQMSFRVG